MTVQKFQNALTNIRDQLKVEKASSYAKDTIIKSLEELVIEVGYDPSNVKIVEELVKKKNIDIAALRKQLKLPPREHPQAKEIVQEANQKDEMMNLILQMTTQIKEMEIEIEKLVQEKETYKAQEIPTTLIPMVTIIVPSTLVEELAPKVPLATTVPVTSSTTSAIESSTIEVHKFDEARKLVKSMEDMSIQKNEINRFKEKIKNLEDAKKLAQINAKTEEQKANGYVNNSKR